MVQFMHPAPEDITLTGILNALGDPVRLQIVRKLHASPEGSNCGDASPCAGLARSTLSNHYRVLREAGLIRTTKRGVEHINVLRLDELERRFPGLVPSILNLADTDPRG
ncbi:ArsR/SmtB family transcription factor [Chelativorans intermedius]|uniref:ArsR/SmtB family transcription factor n=1 Tax=Chelativorans intermedius TaxID=515947 RepID=A0ABV6DBI2_9HYPH|nr:helix-turn-helix domain-containing protein [Chelativorans intermedius]MCT8999351.1 helix-turn-helix domain-containing protein [Chelativorans intermedius]